MEYKLGCIKKFRALPKEMNQFFKVLLLPKSCLLMNIFVPKVLLMYKKLPLLLKTGKVKKLSRDMSNRVLGAP